jgi:hypothetical protein
MRSWLETYKRYGHRVSAIALVLIAAGLAHGQNLPSALSPQEGESLSLTGQWNNFVTETLSPLTAGASIFNGSLSHLTDSDPKYGKDKIAYAQRVGASGADIFTQNFFGDFLVASAFHEDPRYVRLGSEYSFWSRIEHAVSRSWMIQKETGGNTFNWDNFLGTAASSGFATLYYPAPSRNTRAYALHFVTSYFGTGLGDLAPEFWPDFRRWLFHHHLK